jgi:exopolysaccharide biosynthesis polyprenyl glycosylphosphotransferase
MLGLVEEEAAVLVERKNADPGLLNLNPRNKRASVRKSRWVRGLRSRVCFTDTLVVLGACVGGWIVQRMTADTDAGTLRAAAILTLVWLVLLSALRSREVDVLGTGTVEIRRVVQATCLAFGIVALVRLIVGREGDRTLLLTAFCIGMAELLVVRWAWRNWLRTRRVHGECVSRTLVVGRSEDVGRVMAVLQEAHGHPYRIVGTSTTEATAQTAGAAQTARPTSNDGWDAAGVARTAAQLGADTIIVAGEHPNTTDFVQNLYWSLEGRAARLVLAPSAGQVLGSKAALHPVHGLPLLTLDVPTYRGGRHVYKRALDLVTSVMALCAIAVVTPFIALAIKLDSRGPVFFAQQRVGRDGTVFRMYKFRTMVTTAQADLELLKELNEGAGPLFKLKHDPRVTRVGRVLRKLSLDELPQFWNVLRGDMSVVGPRPPLPHEAMDYDGRIARRLYMKPGITGPWQVGGRSDLSWEESVRLDLGYVENWSVAKDLRIMLRTGWVMVHPEGAY